MSAVTKENIYDFFKRDCLDKHGFKLIAEVGAEKAVQDLCGYNNEPFTPERLRAAWNFYISDKKEVEFGISVKRFTEPRVLMKFAAKIQRPERRGQSSGLPQRNYTCENYAKTCCYGVIVVRDEGDEFPDYHERPCPYCNGRLVKEGVAIAIPVVASAPSKPVFDDLVPAPPLAVSLPAVSSAELSDCAPPVEWGDVADVDVGDEDDGILF